MTGQSSGVPASIMQLASRLQAGTLDPVELAEQTFAAIEAAGDPAIFIVLTRERALAEAKASARRLGEGRSKGILDGVPIAWKDLFDFAGLATTVGSTVLRDAAPAARDAAVVERLAAAGMVAVGRTNMTEFAFSGIGLNPHYGTPVNPPSKGGAPRVPGGSSSGSAVAVAAGIVPVAIGSDTGGSVRVPAAFNGVVGYKATRGRYPMEGVFPLATSLDSLGPLTRSVEDAVVIDAAMRGELAPEITRGSISGLELLVPTNIALDGAEDAVVANFEAALERLAKAGAKITRRAVPSFDAMLDVIKRHGALVTAEAYALHEARLATDAVAAMDHRVVERMRQGAKIGMTDFIALRDGRARFTAQAEADIGRALVVFPTVPHVAPEIAPLEADKDEFFRINAKTLRNTTLGNLLDWCGVSIPSGTGAHGMPTSFLISGVANDDDRLLSYALAAEAIIRGELG